jgi:hypothetical protein
MDTLKQKIERSFVGRVKKSNASNPGSRIQEYKNQYITSQPQTSGIELVTKESKLISKTQAKKGREKLSKNNFRFDLEGNEIIDQPQYGKPRWLCHKYCSDMGMPHIIEQYLDFYRVVCRLVFWADIWLEHDDIKSRINNILTDIYKSYICDHIQEDMHLTNKCKFPFLREMEYLRMTIEEEACYLRKGIIGTNIHCVVLDEFEGVLMSIFPIKYYTSKFVDEHQYKGIPNGKKKEKLSDSEAIKYYMRILREIYYSRKARWASNTNFKHPILDRSYKEIASEIFSNSLDQVFDKIQEFRANVEKIVIDGKPFWFKMIEVKEHANDEVAENEVNVYQRFSQYITTSEISKLDKYVVIMMQNYKIQFLLFCAMLHMLCLMTGFSTYWCYIIYVTVFARYLIWATLFKMTDVITQGIEPAVKKVSEVLGSKLTEVGRDLSGKYNILDTLGKGLNKHKVGLTACVYDISTAQSTSSVLSEVVKIGSMLELETSVTNSIIGRLSTATGNMINPQHAETHGVDFEKVIPLIAMGATMTGKTIGDFSITQNMNTMSMNIKNTKVIYDCVMDAAKGLGLVTDFQSQIILDVTQELVNIKRDFEWVTSCLAISGNEFLKPEGKMRFKVFKEKVDEMTRKMRDLNRTKLEKTQVVLEANTLLSKIHQAIVSVELIQKRVTRVIPVGVCLFGSSQVGKTTLSDELHARLREVAIAKYPDHFPDSHSWTKWNAQDRDEYDQNYLGDEIMYADDAFSAKDNLDHQKYLSFISSGAVSTVQADLKAKGRPFNVKVVMTSCNVLPDKSVAINNVNALWERFPITIKCSVKGEASPRSLKNYDKDFKHLKFQVGPMSNFIGLKEGNNALGIKEMNLDQIVDMIVDRMAVEQTKNDQSLSRQEIEMTLAAEDVIVEEHTGDLSNVSPICQRLVFDSRSWYAIKNSLDAPLTSTYQFAWRKHLKMRLTGISFDEALAQGLAELDPYEFLMTLGIWTWKDGEEQQGIELLLKQPPVVIEDYNLTSRYLFFPAMIGDKNLVLITDEMEILLRSHAFYQYVIRKATTEIKLRFVNDMESFKELVQGYWRECVTRKGLIRFSLNVSASILLGPFSLTSMTMAKINLGLLNASQTRRFQRRFFADQPSLVMIGYKIYTYQATAIDFLYQKVDKFVQVVGDTVYEMLIKIFEFIGVEIGPWIDSLLQISSEIVTQTLCFAIVSMIGYAIYKIYQLLTKPKPKKIRHHHAVYAGKHKFTSRKMKKESRKQVTLHNTPVECTEECEFESSGDITTDLNWEVFGESSDILEGKWLHKIMETRGKGYFVSHYQCNDYIHIIGSSSTREIEPLDEGLIYVDHSMKQNPLGEDKIPYIEYELLGSRREWESYKQVFQYLSELKICEYLIEYDLDLNQNGLVVGTIGLYILKGESLEYIDRIDRNVFIDLMCKHHTQPPVTRGILDRILNTTSEVEIEEHSSTMATDLAEVIKEHHLVHITTGTFDTFDERSTHHLFALGHKNMLIMNGHAFKSVGAIVKFWKEDPNVYRLAQVKILQNPGDRAYLRILSYREVKPMIPVGKCQGLTNESIQFRDLSKHLMTCDELIQRYECTPAVMYTHRTKVLMVVEVQHRSPQVYFSAKTGERETREWYAIEGLRVDNAYQRDGECGSPIITSKIRETPKIIGIYSASSGNEHFCSTLWKESLENSETLINPTDRILEHVTSVTEIPMMSKSDPWLELCRHGKPKDTPDGPEVKYIGDYARCTKPVSRTTLDHWNLSPFHEQFDELLQPAPLNPNDDRIEVDLPVNRQGKPSLLAVLNHTISESLPNNDDFLMDFCARNLEQEYNNILDISKTPSDMQELLHMALNGKGGAEYVTGMEVNKAAGLPWATWGAQLKSDMIEIDGDGIRSFKNDRFGNALKGRCQYKLRQANKSVRVVSFSNAKLKDASVKLDYVKIGRGRLYHCIPVEKVIVDAALFGQFKEAYTKAGLTINSAVGINPHSVGVLGLVEHLRQHSNFIDADFTNFDQRIARNILLRVGMLQCNIIQSQNPNDIWDAARRCIIVEDVDTIVVEYQDLTLTNRGNKSGEFKTTINNNIVRELCDYYAWCKLELGDDVISLSNIGKLNLSDFRRQRASIGFGDDEVEGISNELIEKYDFLTKKTILNSIGMVVTPGSKTKLELKSTPFEDLSFLKRKFVFQYGMWTMPLDKRSLEAPFVWTKIQEHELGIWYELVRDRLFEACLHGEEYYNEFVGKLSKCVNRSLLVKINPLISQPYSIVLDQYMKIYYD